MLPSEEKAQRLKLQGNALHEKGEHQAAYDKYSKAINEDPTNAILYANRSASSLSMKEFLDAVYDAQKATKLDPKYAKAWARLANATQGLGAWDRCFEAWEAALACLPSQDLTSSQKALQAQFREGLKASKAAKAKTPPPSRLVAVPLGCGNSDLMKMPWVRAVALEKEALASQEPSSALVLLYASRTFEKGVKSMKSTVKRDVEGELEVEGTPNAIEAMSNAILIDRRCFYMDSREWLPQFMEQLKFEGEYYQAWSQGGSQIVLSQSLSRLERYGWSSLGPALCMTVRMWIMLGFLSGSTGNQSVAANHFRNALDVIEWGRVTWKDVPRSVRGDIFDITFMRSVNRLFIAAVMDWLETDDPECPYSLQELAKLARSMIQELESNTPEIVDEAQYHTNHPGHYAAAWIYPRADALGVLGWFHRRLASTAKKAEDKKIHLAAAARYYRESAETYPADDEFSPFFRFIAFELLLEHGTPLRLMLPLCKLIRSSFPSVLEIWEFSAMSKRRDIALQSVFDWELESARGLVIGKYTPATVVGLSHR